MMHRLRNKHKRTIQASLHPATGSLRIAMSDKLGNFHWFFFDQPTESISFLEGALELVDPQEGGSDD